MEPENIDWDSIDSTFVEDDTYENFDAPKWVDLSASDEPLVDDEAWFCTHDCNHPKTAQDFLKSTTTTNSKGKLLRFVTFSEILPFRDRNRRENASTAEISSYPKRSDKSRGPSCSGNSDEDNENKNPNFFAPNFDSGTNKLKKKPLMRSNTNRDNPKELNGSKECPVRSHRRPQLRSTFSAQNLLGGREILSQITGFCSELKRLAMKGSSKKGGANEKAPNANGVSEELKEKTIGRRRERVPLLVVKEGTLP